jgi:hypothetical protein
MYSQMIGMTPKRKQMKKKQATADGACSGIFKPSLLQICKKEHLCGRIEPEGQKEPLGHFITVVPGKGSV